MRLLTVVHDNGSATFGGHDAYRYRLTREWEAAASRICWLLLNPSTATARQDDSTVRRVVDFSRQWGFGSVVVVNLFALRTADPVRLRSHPDPVGPDNDEMLGALSEPPNRSSWPGATTGRPSTRPPQCDAIARSTSSWPELGPSVWVTPRPANPGIPSISRVQPARSHSAERHLLDDSHRPLGPAPPSGTANTRFPVRNPTPHRLLSAGQGP